MLPLLAVGGAVGGAVVAFLAGWAMGARRAPTPPIIRDEPVSPVDAVYADVLERHQTGVVVATPSGVIEYRNHAAERLGGTHVGVLIDEAVTKHLRLARDGTPSSETLELFGPPKRVVVVSAQTLPSGRSVAFVDDITDRRRADQVRTDFVANVSHELRTPIGALMVLAETLVDADDPEVISRVVGRMQGEADRASRTIDDLLELSEIEAGSERNLDSVRLADVVSDAVGRAVELAAQHDITISTLDPVDRAGPRAEQLVVTGDRRQLASAVGNVVENAVKYSDPGDVVQVRVRRDGDIGEIAVIDEGVGIPQQDLDRVFERFYRVDRARSRSTGGTGLGLSIVRHVANNHQGTISVESVEGEGTTFVLRLPLVAAAEHDENDPVGHDGQEGVA
jgi:two-component system, OmpR family, sensor histidine kinase SenX3